ncbi:metalloprotease [Streptomyces sp. CB00072]|uniref:protealysin inhibitor emfourin n=1 Tax=Streptomyces sp. CB00072 TaxID=1703928 RepID=UPI00093D832F|nr:protealysin inhibitor emfourin [Streptomyces sp. CB00072]OKI57101.1 metalloprotease [Streptomyces sp. CB00072]
MRIQVSRTGGFAGIARRREVDTEGRADAEEWRALAEEALTSARNTPAGGVPDGFRYEITVGDRTVYCADPDLTGAQRTLVSRVLKEGA